MRTDFGTWAASKEVLQKSTCTCCTCTRSQGPLSYSLSAEPCKTFFSKRNNHEPTSLLFPFRNLTVDWINFLLWDWANILCALNSVLRCLRQTKIIHYPTLMRSYLSQGLTWAVSARVLSLLRESGNEVVPLFIRMQERSIQACSYLFIF